MAPKILFFECTPELSRPVAAMLEINHFHVTRTDDHANAIAHVEEKQWDVMVVEIRSAHNDSGLHFLRHLHSTRPHLTSRIVVISAESPTTVRKELEDIGICEIVRKPVHEAEILQAVLDCLDSTSVAVH